MDTPIQIDNGKFLNGYNYSLKNILRKLRKKKKKKKIYLFFFFHFNMFFNKFEEKKAVKTKI